MEELVIQILKELGVFAMPTVLAILGWLIRKTMKTSDNNTKALTEGVGELTKVVGSMTTQNALTAKSLETFNEKQVESSVNQALLFRKVDVVEHDVNRLKGFCEAKHNVDFSKHSGD